VKHLTNKLHMQVHSKAQLMWNYWWQ